MVLYFQVFVFGDSLEGNTNIKGYCGRQQRLRKMSDKNGSKNFNLGTSPVNKWMSSLLSSAVVPSKYVRVSIPPQHCYR